VAPWGERVARRLARFHDEMGEGERPKSAGVTAEEGAAIHGEVEWVWHCESF